MGPSRRAGFSLARQEWGQDRVDGHWPARGCPSLTPSSASYEQVKMDDGKRLQKVRDGQELDYGAAISLLQAMGVDSVLSAGGAAGEGEERCLLLHLLPLAVTQIPPPVLLAKFSFN